MNPRLVASTWAGPALAAALVTAASVLVGCGGGSGVSNEPNTAGSGIARRADAPSGCAGATADGWCQVLPVGRAEVIDSVDFVDARHGWMAGREGTMLRTTDGGASWLPVQFPVRDRIHQVFFIDPQSGLATTSSGLLWRSGDGGRTWAAPAQPLLRVQRIRSAGPSLLVIDGFLPGNPYQQESAVSEDGGRSWRLSAEPVVAVEANGRLWGGRSTWLRGRSDDGGRSFVPEPALFSSPYCTTLTFEIEADGWAHCIGETGIFNTRRYHLAVRPGFDVPWMALLGTSTTSPFSLDLAIDSRGGLAVTEGSLWRTTDAARSWQPVALPPEWFVDLPPPMPWATPRPSNRADNALIRVIDSRTAWVQTLGGRGEGARPLYLSFDAGATWSASAHPSPRQLMNRVSAVERDRSGALLINYGAGAAWFRSSDRGASWQALPMALGNWRNERIADFLSLGDDGRMLALSFTGELFDSADDGRSWQRRAQADQLPGFDPGDLLFASNSYTEFHRAMPQMMVGGGDRVWLVNDGRLFRSRDGSRGFEQVGVSLPDELAPRRMVWVDGLRLVLEVWRPCRPTGVGWPSSAPACPAALAASDDGGTTWRLLPDRWWDWSRVHFFNALEGVRADLREVWRTRDGGTTWQRIFFNADALEPIFGLNRPSADYAPWLEPRRLVQSGDRRLWALFEFALYRSDDGGERWGRVTLPPWATRTTPTSESPELTAIHFADADHGWIVGGGGLLMSTQDGGSTWRFEETATTQRLSAVAGAPGGGTAWLGGAHNMIFVRPGTAPSGSGAATVQVRTHSVGERR